MIQGMIQGESEQNGDRTLLGHTFAYPRLLDTAFTAANFFVGSSIEFFHQGDVTTRFALPDGSVEQFSFDRDIGFVRLRYGVDFQLHELFSMGLEADYLAEVGANEEAIILHGGQTGFDFRPNMKFRIVRSDEYGSQLAIRAHGTFQGGIRAVPQGLLVELSEQLTEIANDPRRSACLVEANFDCAFSGNVNIGDAIRVSRSRFGGGGSLNYAQALNRYLGGQLSVGVEGAQLEVSAPALGDINASSVVFNIGISPSLNLDPTLPIGMTLEYRFQVDSNSYDASPQAGIDEAVSTTANSHRFGAGLYYTGRRDLMLGWIAGVALLEDAERVLDVAQEQPEATVFAAQFDMRYFF